MKRFISLVVVALTLAVSSTAFAAPTKVAHPRRPVHMIHRVKKIPTKAVKNVGKATRLAHRAHTSTKH